MTEALSKSVAAAISRLLAARSWSGRRLAQEAGIPPATVARKLAGTSAFDLDDLQKVARALDVEVSAILPHK